MIEIDAVYFDMDGVLIDSLSEIEKFWIHQAGKYGININDEILKSFVHGQQTEQTINSLFQSQSESQKSEILYAAKAVDINMSPAPVEGVLEFIRFLHNSKIRIGLVTSSHYERAEKILNSLGLFRFFDYTITANDTNIGKPDPAPYLLMSKKTGIDPHRAIVFEDSVSGIQSAINAGMNVIAITHNEDNDRIRNLGVKKMSKNFKNLKYRKEEKTIEDIFLIKQSV